MKQKKVKQSYEAHVMFDIIEMVFAFFNGYIYEHDVLFDAFENIRDFLAKEVDKGACGDTLEQYVLTVYGKDDT